VPHGTVSGEIRVERADMLLSNGYHIDINIVDFHLRMIKVNKGAFTMGDNDVLNSTPEHEVIISYYFYMSECLITQKLYRDIVKTSPPSNASGIDSVPVHFITFVQAATFCNMLSDEFGLPRCYTINGQNVTCDFRAMGYRLPTEAE